MFEKCCVFLIIFFIVKKMSSLIEIELSLTDPQLRKLAKHQGVLIKSHQVSPKGYKILVEPKTHASLHSKSKKGKGHVLKLTKAEHEANIVMEGGRITWKSIGRTLRKGAQTVGKFYKDNLKPVVGPHLKEAVKQGVKKIVPLALDALTGFVAPELAPITAPIYERLGDKISEPITEGVSRLTGAYGLKKHHPKVDGMYFLHSAHSPIPVNHQSLNPLPSLPDAGMASGAGLYMSGGGGLFMSGGGLYLHSGSGVKQPVMYRDHSQKY
jgi:hypothetical protein